MVQYGRAVRVIVAVSRYGNKYLKTEPVPIHAELTTQQAADFLGVSRPHFVSLVERGELPYHTVDTHRRIYFRDVLDYRTRRVGQSRAALDA